MSFGGGFLSEIGGALKEKREREQQAQDIWREHQADEIDRAIQGIQQNTTMSPEQKAAAIDQARQHLQTLYPPTHAPQFMKRLQSIFHREHAPQPMDEQIPGGGSSTGAPPGTGGTPTAPRPQANAPMSEQTPIGGSSTQAPPAGGLQVHPNMKLSEIFAMASPAQAQPKVDLRTIHRQADGSYAAYQTNPDGSVSLKPMPEYSEEDEVQRIQREYKEATGKKMSDEDAKKMADIRAGIEAKPGAKGARLDKLKEEDPDSPSGMSWVYREADGTERKREYVPRDPVTEHTSKTSMNPDTGETSTRSTTRKVMPPASQPEGKTSTAAKTPKTPAGPTTKKEQKESSTIAGYAQDAVNTGKLPPGREGIMTRHYMQEHGMVMGSKETPEATAANKAADVAETTFNIATERSKSPTPIGDTGIVLSWAKTQILGGGRMNNTEIERGLKSGSFGTRLSNAYNKAVNGTLDDGFRKEMVADLGKTAKEMRATANKYKKATSEAGTPENPIIVKPEDLIK